MTQSSAGAQAALRGYRLQALYTLKRILISGMKATQVFQPEGSEDLDILNPENELIEAIQVKSYDGLVLSYLEPEKEASFFHRAIKLLESENPPVIRLVNFGPIGRELDRAWHGDAIYQERIITKLVEKGFEPDQVKALLESVELKTLDEEIILEEILKRIRNLPTGIDPENAFDLFIAWYYQIAEYRQRVNCEELIEKVNDVSRFLAKRYNYHQQWYTTIEPLEGELPEEDQCSKLRKEFYAGIRTRYEHILADLDFPRGHKITEIFRGFQKSKVVIVHAASGQGKSTLAYRYLHEFYPEKWCFEIKRVQDVEHALSIARALSGFARAVEIPIAVYLDVNPYDTEWPELVRQLAYQPSLHILVTIREEDYHRANISGADFDFTEVGLDFDKAEAKLLYERALATGNRWNFLDFDEAWDAFGGKGPLMEFVYLLTQTETLQQRLSSQLRRIEEEVRCSQVSQNELQLLSLVAVASAYGARLRTRDVIETLDLPSPNRTLTRYEQEYLLRRTADGIYLEGLHPIRSEILSHLLIQPDINPWLDVVGQALPLLIEQDLETFILHALIDERYESDHKSFLEMVMALDPKSWSGIGGVLRSLLWSGARAYIETNRSVLDTAHDELGVGWWFAVDLDFTLSGESPKLGEWWTTLGDLLPSERQQKIRAIRESQTPKQAVFQRARGWLRSLRGPTEPPSTPQDWRAVAEVWYWMGRLTPDRSFIDWIPENDLDASVKGLPLRVLADMAYSLYQTDEKRYQEWLADHEDDLLQRIAEEENVLALEENNQTLKVHFIPSGDVEGDSSDFLHNETIAKLNLIRRLYPQYERYGSQGYGFKLAGIDLPQGDSTYKEGVPATYLLPKWPVWLNGTVSGIARYMYRPDSWDAYLDSILEMRRGIIDCARDLNHGLVKFYRRSKAMNLMTYIDVDAWRNCWLKLSGVMDLPKTAVDPWGFASETAAGSHIQSLVQQKHISTADALLRFKSYLEIQRKYLASVRNFLDQAPATWITNAYAGKLRPTAPGRKLLVLTFSVVESRAHRRSRNQQVV